MFHNFKLKQIEIKLNKIQIWYDMKIVLAFLNYWDGPHPQHPWTACHWQILNNKNTTKEEKMKGINKLFLSGTLWSENEHRVYDVMSLLFSLVHRAYTTGWLAGDLQAYKRSDNWIAITKSSALNAIKFLAWETWIPSESLKGITGTWWYSLSLSMSIELQTDTCLFSLVRRNVKFGQKTLSSNLYIYVWKFR